MGIHLEDTNINLQAQRARAASSRQQAIERGLGRCWAVPVTGSRSEDFTDRRSVLSGQDARAPRFARETWANGAHPMPGGSPLAAFTLLFASQFLPLPGRRRSIATTHWPTARWPKIGPRRRRQAAQGRVAVPACDADLSLGAAADQHARHEGRLGKGFRRRLQRSAGLEEASRRQDAGDDAQLRRHLRHELSRPRQGRPDGVRGAAGTAGHPARFLAAPDPGSDDRRERFLRRRRLRRARTAARAASS